MKFKDLTEIEKDYFIENITDKNGAEIIKEKFDIWLKKDNWDVDVSGAYVSTRKDKNNFAITTKDLINIFIKELINYETI